MVDRVLSLPERTRLYLLAPVVRGRKGEYRKEIADWMKKGFQRLKIDGQFYEIADAPALDKKLKHDIEVVVDRIVVRPDMAARLAESFETALELADGLAVVEFADAPPARGEMATARLASRAAPPRHPRLNPGQGERRASSSPRNSPAPSPASPSPRSSRGCSRSTIRTAPVRSAGASARI